MRNLRNIDIFTALSEIKQSVEKLVEKAKALGIYDNISISLHIDKDSIASLYVDHYLHIDGPDKPAIKVKDWIEAIDTKIKVYVDMHTECSLFLELTNIPGVEDLS